MRRSIPLLISMMLLISCALHPSHEDLYTRSRQRTDYLLTLTTVPERLQMGDTLFRARLDDRSGAPISDAAVTFDLQMREMKYMRRVEQGRPASGGVYEARVDLNMGGEWIVSVEVARPGLKPFREKFIIDVGPM